MNKISKFLLSGLLVVPCAVSCDVLEPVLEPVINFLVPQKEPTVFKVDGKTLAGALDSELLYDVQCDIAFTAELENADWASIKSIDLKRDKSGGSILISFSPNAADEGRTGVLVVKSGSQEQRKEFKQFGLSNFFSPRRISLSGVTPSVLAFEAPKAWSAKVVSGQEWFTIDKQSGLAGKVEIKVTALDPNEDFGSREGALQVSIIGVDMEIPVYQGQKDAIYADEADIQLEYSAGEFSVPTRFNIAYEVIIQGDWIHHVSTKALQEATELFVVDENPGEDLRTGIITFVGKDNPDVVASLTVEQKGLDMVLRQTVPGLYGIECGTIMLGQDGWNHSSRVRLADGELVYRLMNPASLGVVSVSGIDPSAEAGAVCSLHIVRRDKADVTMIADYDATVLASDESMLWLKTSKQTYFIVKK